MKESKQNTKRLFWSRVPGKFVDKYTGKYPSASSIDFRFSGMVKGWYETLGETIKDGISLIRKRQSRRPPSLMEVGSDAMSLLRRTKLLRTDPDANCDGLFGDYLVVKERKDIPRNEIRLVLLSDIKSFINKYGLLESQVLPQMERQDELIIEILDMPTL